MTVDFFFFCLLRLLNMVFQVKDLDWLFLRVLQKHFTERWSHCQTVCLDYVIQEYVQNSFILEFHWNLCHVLYHVVSFCSYHYLNS